jgi:hypothetical protein
MPRQALLALPPLPSPVHVALPQPTPPPGMPPTPPGHLGRHPLRPAADMLSAQSGWDSEDDELTWMVLPELGGPIVTLQLTREQKAAASPGAQVSVAGTMVLQPSTGASSSRLLVVSSMEVLRAAPGLRGGAAGGSKFGQSQGRTKSQFGVDTRAPARCLSC